MNTCKSLSCASLRVPSLDMKCARGVIAAVVAWLIMGTMVGCGGGGGAEGPVAPSVPVVIPAPPAPSPPPPVPVVIPDYTATSVYGATLAGDGVQDFIVVVLDGYFYGVHGTGARNDFKAAGLVIAYGNSAPNPGSYHFVADGLDTKGGGHVKLDLVLDLSIPSISGTITSASDARTVAGGTIPSPAYIFNRSATLDAIRGHWALTTATGAALAIDIGADGVVQGTLGRCTLYDSAIKPSISGKNVFALVLRARSGQFACEEPEGGSDGVYGFALAFPSAGGGTQLIIGAENGWDPVYLAAAGKR